MLNKNGFTLVEILIVVVILGILAAIVVPQFTEASNEAKLSSLCCDLQTLRSQIELYKIQHNDIPPTLANFIDQMTDYTNVDGDVQPAAGPGVYGPYMQKVPINQFNNKFAADDINGKLDNSGEAGDNFGSWEYDETKGAIYADDNYDGDDDGTADHKNL